MTIRLLRATAAAFTSGNPVLVAGQPAFEKDTNKIKVGDGVTAWVDLDYISADSGPAAWADVTGKPTLFSGAYGDLSGIPSTFTPSAHSHDDATGLAAGFMSAADKTKLDGLSAGPTYPQLVSIASLRV
jgi:hypothetical protein